MRKLRFKKSIGLILLSTFLMRSMTLSAASINTVPVDNYGSLLTLNEAISRTLESDARVKEAIE